MGFSDCGELCWFVGKGRGEVWFWGNSVREVAENINLLTHSGKSISYLLFASWSSFFPWKSPKDIVGGRTELVGVSGTGIEVVLSNQFCRVHTPGISSPNSRIPVCLVLWSVP